MSPHVEHSFLEEFYKNRDFWSHDFLMKLCDMLVDILESRKSDCENFLRGDVVNGIQNN